MLWTLRKLIRLGLRAGLEAYGMELGQRLARRHVSFPRPKGTEPKRPKRKRSRISST